MHSAAPTVLTYMRSLTPCLASCKLCLFVYSFKSNRSCCGQIVCYTMQMLLEFITQFIIKYVSSHLIWTKSASTRNTTYMYVYIIFRLTLPKLDGITVNTVVCLHFHYHMDGAGVGSLAVALKNPSWTQPRWFHRGTKGVEWIYHQETLTVNKDTEVRTGSIVMKHWQWIKIQRWELDLSPGNTDGE